MKRINCIYYLYEKCLHPKQKKRLWFFHPTCYVPCCTLQKPYAKPPRCPPPPPPAPKIPMCKIVTHLILPNEPYQIFVCPKCDGEKEDKDAVPSPMADGGNYYGPCRLCDGKGYIKEKVEK